MAHAVPTYAISFDDPGGVHAAYYQEIDTDVQAAGAAWVNVFGDYGTATIGIELGFDAALPTMEGVSTGSHLVGRDPRSGVALYEQGAAAKLKGDIQNAPGIDGRITIGEGFLTSGLWFDPSPAAGTSSVPSDKIDAYSTFIHELGHIFAFDGWRDGRTGALGGNYESTFDHWVVPQDGNLFFEGPQAEAAYRGPVPLTWGDYGHVGNGAGRPGEDLIPDLMNGVTWLRGARYEISALDKAIAADAGLPVVGLTMDVAEPSSLVLFGSGILLVPLCRRQREIVRGIISQTSSKDVV
jgi:hypothetical protein